MSFCVHCMAPLEPGMQFCQSCGASQAYTCPENHLLPGTTLANGRFLLGAAIGAGGFGITYIAQDLRLRVPVAIKEYYPVGYANRSNTTGTERVSVSVQQRDFFERGKEKFLVEARFLASLNDEPGIVSARDFFEENGTAYLVMEYLKGETLKAYLARRGKLPFTEAYSLLQPVMHSLRAVHAKDVIHRDISPDNIMITGDGVKLLDFGAARAVFADGEHSMSVVLKRGFAPLEQYSRHGQGPWTDVYALCATLYKCITGSSPMESLQRLHETMQPPSALGAVITPTEEDVLMHGLALQAQERIRDVDTLLRAFQAAEAGVSAFAPRPVQQVGVTMTASGLTGLSTAPVESTMAEPPRRVLPTPEATQAVQLQPPMPPQPQTQKKTTKWWLVALIAVLVLSLAGVGTWWMLHEKADGTETADTTQTAATTPTSSTTTTAPTTTTTTAPTTERVKIEIPTDAAGHPDYLALTQNSATYLALKDSLVREYGENGFQLYYVQSEGCLNVWIIAKEGTYNKLMSPEADLMKEICDDYLSLCKKLSKDVHDKLEAEGYSGVDCVTGILNDAYPERYFVRCENGRVTDNAFSTIFD